MIPYSFKTTILCCLLVYCALCFEIKTDENIVTFSSSNKPRIHFTISRELNEEIESLELILGNQSVSIAIQDSNEYSIELPDSFKIVSGRSLTFEFSSIISSHKCCSSKDFTSIELICEEESRISPISARIGLHEKVNEILENPTVCFDEWNGLWDSCSTDLTSFISVKCSHLQKCSPFLEMNSISQRTNCESHSDLFVSVSFKCLRSYSFFKKFCFQFDLNENEHFSASLIPDSASYPLFKGNIVVFFTTTIPQQCETDQANPLLVFLSNPFEIVSSQKISLSDSSTIYEVDFGAPVSQTYTLNIHFVNRQLITRSFGVSSATVITSPPTPFDFSISVDSSIVTFKWKKLNFVEFTSKIEFDCDEFHGIAYYHFGEPMIREDAKNHCNSLDDSFLPTLRSICRLEKLIPHMNVNRRYWIGLTDDLRNVDAYDPVLNIYRWDDGSTQFSMIGNVWLPNEPNNAFDKSEHCYEIAKGRFNDERCEGEKGIRPLCEKRNFDCDSIEPKYSILIYDDAKRFLSQYQYNGDDIRTNEEFSHEISDLENGKNYHYLIRSENCGVSKSTDLIEFKHCFDESPNRIEKTSYRVGVVSEIHSFSFPLLLPFFGIVCSDSESLKTIKISPKDEHYDCSANPNEFTIPPKTSLVTCELKSNFKHSSSLSLDVLLSNGSHSESLTLISVLLCPLFADHCSSDCFEICVGCSFLDASSCVFPCSWCSSSNSCEEACSEASSSSLILILICVLIPVFVLLIVIVIVIVFVKRFLRKRHSDDDSSITMTVFDTSEMDTTFDETSFQM